ncbi:hypothetical protein Glove_48g45 [Diversispora epigaea]|uniref:Uncharacterized protein n=1 Tax=Diversispora epigaea TaxID=1348612 RepID=A0A397JKS2_9GLOM|nr:hypothetical protein Glove_48g45 [Diversispora epigaea]
MGSLIGRKEVTHSKFFDLVLQESLDIATQITKKSINLDPDYDLKVQKLNIHLNSNLEELICITEAKGRKEDIGIIRNIMQLDNTLDGKPDESFKDYDDYVYGIVTTAEKWFLIMYTSKVIYRTYDFRIGIEEYVLKGDTELREKMEKVMEVIVSLLKDGAEVDDSFISKENNVKNILSRKI